MALSLEFFFLILAIFGALLSSTMGADYEVGDSAGWNVMGTDYNAWTAGKNFRVGDTIVFKYNPTIHNVMEVRKSDYQTCTSTAPIQVFTSGSDSIQLQDKKTYYFLCGVSGHCQAGLHVAIKVLGEGQSTPTAAPPARTNNTSPELPYSPGSVPPRSDPQSGCIPYNNPILNPFSSASSLGKLGPLMMIVASSVFVFYFHY